MAKIAITTVIDNGAGTIYCAGFVNGKYIQVLGSNKLTKKDFKGRMLDKYNKLYNMEEDYGKEPIF